MNIPCIVDDLSTMWERGQKIYGHFPGPAASAAIMRPSIAQKPCYLYDPVVATWEDFNLAEVDGSGMLTMTVARDPRQPRSPRVTGADHDGHACVVATVTLSCYGKLRDGGELWRLPYIYQTT